MESRTERLYYDQYRWFCPPTPFPNNGGEHSPNPPTSPDEYFCS
ncbi:hypothetical protein LINPERPRIM_LOCUS2870 [Linum perenne]